MVKMFFLSIRFFSSPLLVSRRYFDATCDILAKAYGNTQVQLRTVSVTLELAESIVNLNTDFVVIQIGDNVIIGLAFYTWQ